MILFYFGFQASIFHRGTAERGLVYASVRAINLHLRHCEAAVSEFVDYLQSIDGGCKEKIQAEEICIAPSRYLYWCNADGCDFSYLLNEDSIFKFLECFQKHTLISAAGLTSIIDSMRQALKFARFKFGPSQADTLTNIDERLKNWRRSLAKGRSVSLQQCIKKSTDLISKLPITILRRHKEDDLRQRYNAIVKILVNESYFCSMSDLSFSVRYPILVYLLPNLQRPGPAENLSLQEFADRTVDDDGLVTITVSKHKTAETSPAYMHIESSDMPILLDYLQHIRPRVASKDSPPLFFLNTSGQQITNLSRKLGTVLITLFMYLLIQFYLKCR